MKANRKPRYSASASPSTVTYTFRNETSAPPKTSQIPITVHLHDHSAAAAAKIQAAYRAHTVRRLLQKIYSVEAETDRLEGLIQLQETVDAVRSSEKEKMRMNEALMNQLLKLDSIPGFDPGVRELRRSLSRRIVALQEVMDGICGERLRMDGWDDVGLDWDEVIGRIEQDVCRERGGDELEMFCANNLGFRCLQRFLSHP
ncbi:BAG family molecular chaperone regulator 5, mitochondrial [Silene latifolia]|uniref:BAG family molecular chaperone regulator 5, mitochondrial n=1 Tax=Silene latifolia TaxID=37657 RepID=UPI003D77B164